MMGSFERIWRKTRRVRWEGIVDMLRGYRGAAVRSWMQHTHCQCIQKKRRQIAVGKVIDDEGEGSSHARSYYHRRNFLSSARQDFGPRHRARVFHYHLIEAVSKAIIRVPVCSSPNSSSATELLSLVQLPQSLSISARASPPQPCPSLYHTSSKRAQDVQLRQYDNFPYRLAGDRTAHK